MNGIGLKSQFNTRPLFLQLRDHIVRLIASSEWPAGHQLKNEVDLAKEFGVSVGTVRKALNDLTSDGLIERRQGRGTFVSDQLSNERSVRFTNFRGKDGQPLRGNISVRNWESGESTEEEANLLRLKEGEAVYRCVRVREQDGHNFLYETIVMAKRIVGALDEADFLQPLLVFIAARKSGLILSKALETVSIAVPPAHVAESLGVPASKPLLHLRWIAYSMGDRPVGLRLGYCDLGENAYVAVQG